MWEAEAKKEAELAAKNQPQPQLSQQPQMPQQQSNISHLPLAQQAMVKAITAKAPMAPTSSKAPAMQPFPAIPAIPKAPMQANTPTTSSFTTGWSFLGVMTRWVSDIRNCLDGSLKKKPVG